MTTDYARSGVLANATLLFPSQRTRHCIDPRKTCGICSHATLIELDPSLSIHCLTSPLCVCNHRGDHLSSASRPSLRCEGGGHPVVSCSSASLQTLTGRTGSARAPSVGPVLNRVTTEAGALPALAKKEEEITLGPLTPPKKTPACVELLHVIFTLQCCASSPDTSSGAMVLSFQ